MVALLFDDADDACSNAPFRQIPFYCCRNVVVPVVLTSLACDTIVEINEAVFLSFAFYNHLTCLEQRILAIRDLAKEFVLFRCPKNAGELRRLPKEIGQKKDRPS